MKELPCQSDLRELLDYNPDTGVLLWKSRSSRGFNPQLLGKPALTTLTSKGYLEGLLRQTRYYAHRVIWKWMTGEEPQEIDHINGCRSDNRWENLRSVVHAQNLKNQSKHPKNTSGVTGVYPHKGRWKAQIWSEGRCVYLGTYSSLEEASKVRKDAEKRFGFHQNHGGNKQNTH